MMNQDRRKFIGYLAGSILFPKLVLGSPKRKLIVGNLELEIVDPSNVSNSAEYVDPNNTGNPIVHIPENMLNEFVTKNFKLGEFARINDPEKIAGTKIEHYQTSSGLYHTFIRLDTGLPVALQKLRDNFGQALTIKSPFRNITYNERCNGKSGSRHVSGQAADIVPSSGQGLGKLYDLADKQFANGGVGKYSTFIHVDVRGFKARW